MQLRSVMKSPGYISFFHWMLLLYFLSFPQKGFTQGYKLLISSTSTEKPTKGFALKTFTNLRGIIPTKNGGFISLMTTWKEGDKFDESQLVLQNAGLDIVADKEMFADVKSAVTIGLVEMKNGIYFLYASYQKKVFSVFAQQINGSNLEPEGSPVLLTEFDKVNDWDYSNFEIKRSPDSGRLLIICIHTGTGREKKPVDYVVLDNEMKKLYSNRFTFEQSFSSVAIGDCFLATDGAIYIVSLIDRKGNASGHEKNDDGTKISPYDLHLLKIDEKSNKDRILPTNRVFIHSLHVIQRRSGHIDIAGIYGAEYDKKPLGVYRLGFELSGNNESFKTYAFPATIAEKLDPDAKFFPPSIFYNNSNSFPGKMFEDGESIYLFEQYHTVSKMAAMNYNPIFYKDIIFCGLLPGDTVRYNLIENEYPAERGVVAFTKQQASFYLEDDGFKLWNYRKVNGPDEKKRAPFITFISKNGEIKGNEPVFKNGETIDYGIGVGSAFRFGKNFVTMGYKNDRGYLCYINPIE